MTLTLETQLRRTASKPSAIGTQTTRGCFGLPGVLNFSPPLISRPRVLLKPATTSPEYRALKSLFIVLAMATPQIRPRSIGPPDLNSSENPPPRPTRCWMEHAGGSPDSGGR